MSIFCRSIVVKFTFQIGLAVGVRYGMCAAPDAVMSGAVASGFRVFVFGYKVFWLQYV